MKTLFLTFLVCFATPSFASVWQSQNLTTPAGSIDLLVYASKSASTQAQALLVVLHGCAQSNQELAKNGNLIEAADEYGFVVALPQVPNKGVYVGCWDYYGQDHARENRHHHYLLNVIEQLKNQQDLNINEKLVFVSGLSSGAGQAMLLACLAPEIIAGVSTVAAPGLGTLASQLVSPPKPKLEFATEAKELCLSMSGPNAESLKTQISSMLFAKNDKVVNPEYGLYNEVMYQQIYGLHGQTAKSLESQKGSKPRGEERLWVNQEGKVQLSVIEHESLGHRWPGGQGGRAVKYIHRSSVDYPAYMMNFFKEHSLR
jgi:poly(3-hydroxybutyrate) depolymerase